VRLFPTALLLALILSFATTARSQSDNRFALLIGNQGYQDNVGKLKNPHHDIAMIGAELRKVGFTVNEVRDAGYRELETALRRHIQLVRRAGPGALGFLYYSGHGAVEPETQINYLIPVDVPSADDADLWTNSIDLREIINRLRAQSPDATHYVVFDACRDELRLTRAGKKALGTEKGFVPFANTAGVMVAYSTAPGQTASDVGAKGGPYARALAAEIAKPGVESVTMFRNVQLRVKQEINQDPWLSFPTLPAVYFGGLKVETTNPERAAEAAAWAAVKDSSDPAALLTYLDKYPNGEFAALARRLIELQDRTRAAEKALSEQSRQREELRKAEAARLEAEAAVRDSERQAALAKQSEELKRTQEDARKAREALAKAEQEREAARKAAQEAKSAADKALADREAAATKAASTQPQTPTPTPKAKSSGSNCFSFNGRTYCQ